MIEVGTSLAQARLARGLTLEDAERSTRIARKFLIALEEHNYAVFPAPVYARGFLRTYCRYLGLDPEEQLAELPAGWNGITPATHLPPVSRPINLNMTWLVVGVILASLIASVYLFTRSDDGIGGLQANVQDGEPQQQTGQSQQSESQQGQQQQQPQVNVEPSSSPGAAGRVLEPGIPGVLPDFAGVSVEDATAFLEQQGVDYLLVDTPDAANAAGLIIEQEPVAGEGTAAIEMVTLTVSMGDSQPTAARTDCALLSASQRRSSTEHAWFQENCTAAAPVSGDRTNCEEIRGTAYRSPSERQFFLANCIIG